MNRETLLSLRSTLKHEHRDWNWWSWFLARHYFGASSENRHWDSVARSLVKDLNLQPGMRLLDIGSGCGELEFCLAQRGLDVVGIDNSELLIADCQKIAANRGIPAQFQQQNMFHFRPTSKFDAVICINTSFGYGTDQQNRELIERIPEWLLPEGRFYLDLIVADNATTYGIWSDDLADGTLIVDNSYDESSQEMASLPHWITPDDMTIYTAEVPERVKLYHIAEIESMLEKSGLKGRELQSGPGKRTRETGANMTRTWIASLAGTTVDENKTN